MLFGILTEIAYVCVRKMNSVQVLHSKIVRVLFRSNKNCDDYGLIWRVRPSAS